MLSFLEFGFNLPCVHNPWENVPSKFLQPSASFKKQGPGRSVFLLITKKEKRKKEKKNRRKFIVVIRKKYNDKWKALNQDSNSVDY